jgi:hypothetical protein
MLNVGYYAIDLLGDNDNHGIGHGPSIVHAMRNALKERLNHTDKPAHLARVRAYESREHWLTMTSPTFGSLPAWTGTKKL